MAEYIVNPEALLDTRVTETKASRSKWVRTHVHRYLKPLLEKIEAGKIEPSFVITYNCPLEDGPELYKTFCDKKDGCIKVVLKP